MLMAYEEKLRKQKKNLAVGEKNTLTEWNKNSLNVKPGISIFGVVEADLEDEVLRGCFGEKLWVTLSPFERIHCNGKPEKDSPRQVNFSLYSNKEKRNYPLAR